MAAALALARRVLGMVWPNPAVGCVLVKDGAVVARGWTQPGGRPHGEAEALARAGELARGATAYVSLEPCCHWGKTPPCAEALIAAGVARVVVPIEDPDPRMSGRGLARLKSAGIEVTTGVCAEAAATLNEGFLRRIQDGRPLITVKLASTLDGCIATKSGESQWITGEAARLRGHLMRARHDAVMVGSMTVVMDDPELTCRLPGMTDRSPVRIVVDVRLRVPLTAKVVAAAAKVPTWFITLKGDAPERHQAFRDCGVELIEVRAGTSGVDLAEAFRELGKRGLTRVLVEGGAGLVAALVRAGLVDRLAWFRAPRLIGGDGIPALAAFGLDRLADTPSFERIGIEALGEDTLETFHRGKPLGTSYLPH
jgi:diaminohydroxyphosphoribosylaminopyrimidine deaminase/5-amino-6-(5-phosphoribosylamino)uracil reductase